MSTAFGQLGPVYHPTSVSNGPGLVFVCVDSQWSWPDHSRVPKVWFITGTDTGVGKTVLTVLLANWLEDEGRPYRAVKPFCSGGREDAERLWEAQAGRLSLDQVNPWHYRPPLAPEVAAQKAGRRIHLDTALRFLRRSVPAHGDLLVEGAGGLLTPLGHRFDARALITSLRAIPLVVGVNRLGAINQVRLVMSALPRGAAARARIVLFDGARPDLSTPSNPRVLTTYFGAHRIHRLPWWPDGFPEPMGRGLRKKIGQLLR